jgi:hypothetical protein
MILERFGGGQGGGKALPATNCKSLVLVESRGQVTPDNSLHNSPKSKMVGAGER